MKILTNKENYEELGIGTKWIRKEITKNTHFSCGEPIKIIKIRSCKINERERCIYHSLSDYYDKIQKSLEGEVCAGMTIEYKYKYDCGTECSQCYHTFIEGAEQAD